MTKTNSLHEYNGCVQRIRSVLTRADLLTHYADYLDAVVQKPKLDRLATATARMGAFSMTMDKKLTQAAACYVEGDDTSEWLHVLWRDGSAHAVAMYQNEEDVPDLRK